MKVQSIVAILMASAFLTACGGSGSSGSDDKNDSGTDVVVDPAPDTVPDITPDEFSYTAKTGVERESWINSEVITITGLGDDVSAPIEAGGLEFSIDGGEFTALPGLIKNGQTLQVRVFSSADFSSTRTATVVIGTKSVGFSVTTTAQPTTPPADVTPDVFVFSDKIDVETETWIESDTVTISGLSDNVLAVVDSHDSLQFSIDGEAFTEQSGAIKNGQTLKVRLFSSENYGTQTSASVRVGDTTVTFTIITKEEPEDIVPDEFGFNTQSDVELNTWIESEVNTISGINKQVAIIPYGLEYSIDGADYSSVEGVINNGQTLQVRVLSSNAFNTKVTGAVKVGEFSAYFNAITYAEDVTPDTFAFSDQIDVAKSSWIESEVVSISGINNTVIVSASGLEYSVNGAPYTSELGSIEEGQTLRVRILSNSDFDRTSIGSILIGDYPVEFSVTTLAGIPFITNMSLRDDSVLEIGSNLYAEAECNHCDLSKTEYTWSIEVDGEEQVVATTDTYEVDEQLFSAEAIKLTATAVNSTGITGGLIIQTYALSRVEKIYSNDTAFAAVKTDGSVVTWGDSKFAVDSETSELLNSDIVSIFSNDHAFAALKEDGSVVAWGDSNYGGNISEEKQAELINVTKIYSSDRAFAALKENGTVVAWGDSKFGGFILDSTVPELVNVVNITASRTYFAALKSNGSVVIWGGYGEPPKYLDINANAIYANTEAFAILTEIGAVITKGASSYGGNGSDTVEGIDSNVVSIASTTQAFAALKTDGSVIAWGSGLYGGNSSSVSSLLSSGVVALYSTDAAFAALKDDGSVIIWGNIDKGGYAPVALDLTNVKNIKSTGDSFIAVKHDGSVISWGASWASYPGTGVVGALTSDVVDVFPAGHACAALKTDGSLVTWGVDYAGGNSYHVADQIASGVVNVFSTGYAFAALKDNGSVVLWGHSGYGGTIEDTTLLEQRLVLLNEYIPK